MSESHRTFTFGDFTLDLARGALLRQGVGRVKLRPKSFEVLRLLLERRGCLVSKAELLREVWGHAVVTDGALTQCLIDVRRAIGDESQSIIRTVPRRGYIFEAPVAVSDAPVALSDAASAVPSIAPTVAARIHFGWRSAAVAVIAVFGCAGAAWFALQGDEGPAQQARRISEAEQIYHQGVFFFNRRGAGDLALARRYLDETLRRDPTHARAWSALAGVYGAELAEADVPCAPTVRKRADAIARALALDPMLAEAHIRAAQHYMNIGDVATSEDHHRRAVELAPDSSLVLAHSASVAALSGRLNEAIDLLYRAAAIDPVAAIRRGQLMQLLMLAGRYEEALEQARKQVELSPATIENADPVVAQIYILQRRLDEALSNAQQLPDGPERQQALAMIYHELGRHAEASDQLEALVARDDIVGAVRVAEVYAYRGESNESLRSLRAALEHMVSATELGVRQERVSGLQYSPFLRPLQADPRWQTLIGEWRVKAWTAQHRACGAAPTLAAAQH